MSTFLYEVRPLIKPVKTPEGRATRAPFSAKLTINQVKEYMKVSSVYRKFPDYATPIKVTGGTLEELHRSRFKVIPVATEEVIEEPSVEEVLDNDCSEEVTTEGIEEEDPTEGVEEIEECQDPSEVYVEEIQVPSEKDVAEDISEKVVEKEKPIEAVSAINSTIQHSRNIQFNNGNNNKKKNNHYNNKK